mmetsp:Transcript_32251/g.30740  ORF Transcript_32251/g.30740 Transcript_32251/m.30740 type:complete len:472 (+) Transcript_32251:121-1536(+)
MSKRNRDSNDSLVKNNSSIKISDSTVSQNKKLYRKLPDDLEQESPPLQSPDVWFSFSKFWHPLILVDSNGKNISSKMTVQMEISHIRNEKDNFKVPPHTSIAQSTKGVFWFGAITAHCNGSILLKFTSPGIDPLIHRININEDVQVKSATKAAGTSKRESELGTKNAIEEPKSKQARIKSKAVGKEADVINYKGGIGGASSSVLGGTGGVPKLSFKSRIERTIKPYTSNASKHSSNITRVKGPMLEIILPVSLAVALLDDRARIDSEIMGSKKQDTSAGSKSQAMVPISVSELLTKVQQRAKHQIGECQILILRLSQLFECLFESSILYSSERSAMKQHLASLRAQNITYSDSFGGIYLLRLLVLVVTGADSIYPLSTDLDTATEEILSPKDQPVEVESSLNIDVINSYSSIDMNNDIDKPMSSSSSNTSQSSQQRRIAVQIKHRNNEFYKFQEVLNCALKELEESAHTIF